jgi:hypothetical protein
MKNDLLLYNVIKSMTMNEKRYFKIFCTRHVIGTQNNYVTLYSVINKMTEFDENVFAKKLDEVNYPIKFLASELKYLKKIVFKSLNYFHADKTFNLKIKQQLVSIEILFYKGLYEECLQLIRKVKNNNPRLINYFLLLELLNWEKKCIGYSNGLNNAIEINKKVDTLYEVINHGKIITDFYYLSYYYKNSLGKIPNEEIKSGFEAIFNNPSFCLETTNGFVQLSIYYYLTYSNYYHVNDDDDNELVYLQKTLEVYDTNSILKFENPLDYVSIYIRLIEILKSRDSDLFYESLNVLKQFNLMIDIQKSVVSERIYLFSLQAELEHLIIKKTVFTVEFITEILQNLKTIKYKIEPYYYIKIYYLVASVLCVINDFSGGLKLINKILNEFKYIDRPNIFVKAEFLNIVIHYELKNYELVIYNVNLFKKKYSKEYAINFIEKHILKTIIKITNNPNLVNEKNEFLKLKNKIDRKETDFSKTVNINYYKYIVSKTVPKQ